MFKAEITETLQRTVEIDADAEDEGAALIAAKRQYREEQFVLDSSDFISTDFSIVDSVLS